MSKQKTVWCCSNCGHAEPKWLGQCTQCNQWNTFQEEIDYSIEEKRFLSKASNPSSEPVRIREVSLDTLPRLLTGINELDRLLGGGVIRGSMTLVGGDPGIGKSTLLLQASHGMALQGLIVLYVCGEESVAQTSMRAHRLGVSNDNLLLYSETNFSHIKRQIDRLSPDVVIIDSIQIIYKSELSSAPGS
ncbi:MAG: AAA family ATPase, partial [Chlamydiales bacterium]